MLRFLHRKTAQFFDDVRFEATSNIALNEVEISCSL